MPARVKIDFNRIKKEISDSLKAHAMVSPAQISKIYPGKDLQGKIYEVYVLSKIIENLNRKEGCTIRLTNTGPYTLKQKGSPINRDYPYFTVYRGPDHIGDLFTDTEFTSQSAKLIARGHELNSDYHELDIALFKPGAIGRPPNTDVLLAVECKATTIEKSTFRELLGFRRELGCLVPVKRPTVFQNWPAKEILCDNGSVHMCFSWDRNITKYTDNAEIYGIKMIHEPM